MLRKVEAAPSIPAETAEGKTEAEAEAEAEAEEEEAEEEVQANRLDW